MPSSLAFQVDQYDQENWEQHTRFVEKDVPEPGQGEVLVQVYLRPGRFFVNSPDRAGSAQLFNFFFMCLLSRPVVDAVNPTDVILITTGWGQIPNPAVPGSEGMSTTCVCFVFPVKQPSVCI